MLGLIHYSTALTIQITYIDFEGRSDGDAMNRILTQIKPQQLVSWLRISLPYIFI
jgi:hypothetical protein